MTKSKRLDIIRTAIIAGYDHKQIIAFLYSHNAYSLIK